MLGRVLCLILAGVHTDWKDLATRVVDVDRALRAAGAARDDIGDLESWRSRSGLPADGGCKRECRKGESSECILHDVEVWKLPEVRAEGFKKWSLWSKN